MPEKLRTSQPLALAGVLLAAICCALPASASAATPPTITESFASTGAEQAFTVPVGVSSVRVEAIGASGAGSGLASGGAGADVVGALPVTAGEVLYVEVAASHFNGGGFPGFGGGTGGDASDVRTLSTASPSSLASRLLVAAGGGGAGGTFISGTGGNGGAAANPGTNGTGGSASSGGGAGGPGTLTGGGTAGAGCNFPGPWSGTSGALGLGGNGGLNFGFPNTGGGGGGGGYTGGGGGGGTCSPGPGGGGGGGGANFVFGGATFSSYGAASPSTEPSISISYPSPATATPDTTTIAFPMTQPQQTLSAPQTLTIANEGGNPLLVTGTTFAGSTSPLATDHPEDFLIGSSSCLGPVVFESSCQLTVRFAPQGEGTRTATLQIMSNSGAGPTVVSLTGTAGALPQGPTGLQGSLGPQGTPGPPGNGGAAGPSGSAGTIGARGPTGPQGVAGAAGPRGPAGQTAVYVCHHRRQAQGRFEIACFIRVLGAPKAVASATLTRHGVVYASTTAATIAAARPLVLKVLRPIRPGRYTLALVYRSRATTETIAVG
ncbi:MAG TPA: choice-of-anchor D domain-containing protein [Solirubrobacteraceae bacterium]|jgi:hypothetical protein